MSGVLPLSSHLLAFPTAVPQAAAGAGSEVSSGGVSTVCCLGDVESGRLAPKGTDASLPLPGARAGASAVVGQVEPPLQVAREWQVASLQWSLAGISYLVRE